VETLTTTDAWSPDTGYEVVPLGVVHVICARPELPSASLAATVRDSGVGDQFSADPPFVELESDGATVIDGIELSILIAAPFASVSPAANV
jgi:hypothetical protein